MLKFRVNLYMYVCVYIWKSDFREGATRSRGEPGRPRFGRKVGQSPRKSAAGGSNPDVARNIHPAARRNKPNERERETSSLCFLPDSPKITNRPAKPTPTPRSLIRFFSPPLAILILILVVKQKKKKWTNIIVSEEFDLSSRMKGRRRGSRR